MILGFIGIFQELSGRKRDSTKGKDLMHILIVRLIFILIAIGVTTHILSIKIRRYSHSANKLQKFSLKIF